MVAMDILLIGLMLGLALSMHFFVARNKRTKARSDFIDNYQFPDKLETSVAEAYPHLSKADIRQVIKALREYFHVCNEGGKDFISMPSEVVDIAWHEFILFTRKYSDFCNKAFGRFLHHTPAEGLAEPNLAQSGIRNAWRIACSRAYINPASPSKLPLLFGIDAMLKISNGYHYEIDCQNLSAGNDLKAPYCVTHSLAKGTDKNANGGGCGGGCGSGAADSGESAAGDSGCGGGCGG